MAAAGAADRKHPWRPESLGKLRFAILKTIQMPLQIAETLSELDRPSDRNPGRAPTFFDAYISRLLRIGDSNVPWDRVTWAAFVSLLALWAARMYGTWATWGNLSIDCGHEMYIPALLAEGKVLYRDVWFNFGPAAPYFNAYLFRLFGVHLNVLYWAGSLAALGCAVLLFLTGKQLSSWIAGWTAGAVVLIEAFHAWHFSCPLPYSFSSVYGCLAACLFFWFVAKASGSARWEWILGAGTTAAAALLLKLEYGAACYATLLVFICVRGSDHHSWRTMLRDLAATLPGLGACALVAHWAVSLGGFRFITEENLATTWPTSYFMRTYGKIWLEKTGLALTGGAFLHALWRGLFLATVLWAIHSWLGWRKRDAGSRLLRIALLVAAVAYFGIFLKWRPQALLAAIFFPRDMVLYIAAAALWVWWRLWRQPVLRSQGGLGPALLLTFASLLAIRILFGMTASAYAIYYNGPAVLAFLLLLTAAVPRDGGSRRVVFQRELLICLACLVVAALYAIPLAADSSDLVRLETERGSIRVPSQVASNYRAAIEFMKKEAAQGRAVLSVPEDTSLYFLSGTECPTRLFLFAPGLLVPGRMTDEVIREIESKPVQYLLWSNRTFSDYGAPTFGTDFDRPLGDYLRAHYRRVGPLVPESDLDWQTRFTLWERVPENAGPGPEGSAGAAASTPHRIMPSKSVGSKYTR